MRYYGHHFEQLDKEREREYDEKHLADCKEVKTYKLSPEEIEARYGKCTGSGKYIGPLVDVRNLSKREDDEDMAIHDKQETLNAVLKVMEDQGITEHIPGAAVLAKHAKKYEQSIYHHFGGAFGLSEAIGLPVYQDWKNAEKAKAKLSEIKPAKIEPIEDVSEERFEEAYAAAHQEPEVITMVDEPIIYTEEQTYEPEKAVQDQKVFDAYAHKVAQYEKLSVDILDCMKIENDLRKRQEELNIWLKGFEAAAKLAGVSLE